MTHPSPQQRLAAGLTLLAVSVIWGSAFVVQRLAANEMGPFLFNGLRFLLGAAVLLPFLLKEPGGFQNPFRQHRSAAWGVVAAGLLLSGAAALQQLGLRYTTAGNAGFITGLYVILVPILSTLLWRARLPARAWAAALVSAAGLYLISTQGQFKMNLGDGLELAGAFLWAAHVLLISLLVKRLSIFQISVCQYLVCGLVSTLTGLLFEAGSLAGLPGAGWAILYTGILSVGVGYTLQAVGQKTAPPADAVIILSTEAVFAALFGWVFLGENFSPLQMLGAGLILVSVILTQLALFSKRAAAS